MERFWIIRGHGGSVEWLGVGVRSGGTLRTVRNLGWRRKIAHGSSPVWSSGKGFQRQEGLLLMNVNQAILELLIDGNLGDIWIQSSQRTSVTDIDLI